MKWDDAVNEAKFTSVHRYPDPTYRDDAPWAGLFVFVMDACARMLSKGSARN
jgi:hypothetical protein